MKNKIVKIITEALKEINDDLESKELENITLETKLYGGNAALDSLALVSLITDLEDLISDKFDQDVVLADEKAMSQRTSPFRSVESLSNYIVTLLEETHA